MTQPLDKAYRRERKPDRNADEAISASFDANTRALIIRQVNPQIRYLARTPEAGAEADPDRAFQRSVTAIDADDPNTTAPAATSVVKPFQTDEVVFFADLAAGQTMSVEVWAKTDMHIDHDDMTSSFRWVRLLEETALVSHQEYSVRTGQRAVFFRVATVANISGGSPASLYAVAL